MILQNTRLSLVYNMATLIAEAVNKGLADLLDMEKDREKEARLKVKLHFYEQSCFLWHHDILAYTLPLEQIFAD